MHAKTNPKPCGKRLRAKLIALLRMATWALLTAFSLTVSAGCKTRVLVIPADKKVERMESGRNYTPAINGWFVPDARFQEILTELNNKP